MFVTLLAVDLFWGAELSRAANFPRGSRRVTCDASLFAHSSERHKRHEWKFQAEKVVREAFLW